ncbi:MAG TPA: sugar nucleotide-binding protein, partial [Gemmatimonadaceae bacterium]|nr:sugar nucleotide-binding protein [Gemmatimonadaceae bacterium]
APGDLRDADWSFTDQAFSRLRELDITPIVGFVHHGSGPRHTSLLDDGFPDKLRSFALAVIERYPWIDLVTPINEPLTTARFAGLYALWYPHARDDRSFVRCLMNQCLGIRAAMQAVRSISPSARLVQTEDLGRTYSTPALRYQADFDNERRWLTFDLLCGDVTTEHPFWQYLVDNGATPAELESLVAEPCAPDVIGINHYLTSERFLDERVELYPPKLRGGNGHHAYADVEAVRVLENGTAGHLGLIREAWDRYALPIAITEVHLGCTREQQMLWLDEAWHSALELREEGCDVRAVSVWSLLGSFGWDSLLTEENGTYEPGAFDIRSEPPRPTALATMTRHLATVGRHDHPVLGGDGWWREKSRLAYPSHHSAHVARAPRRERSAARPIVITGAAGTLGSAFARICVERGLKFVALRRSDLDVTHEASVSRVLDELKPWAVINASGYVRVDDAEHECASCYRVNTKGAVTLGTACAEKGIRFVTFSSDLVFDGETRKPYVESDSVNPLCVYGKSKAEAEACLLSLREQPLIIRTSAFFGPWDSYNFLASTLSALAAGSAVQVADDLVVSPTYVPDLVNVSLDLLIDDERGLWHLANRGELTWFELACRVAESVGLCSSLIAGRPERVLGYAATRPRYSAIASERGTLMPTLDDAIARYTSERAEVDGSDARAANA